jgi:TonB family protein
VWARATRRVASFAGGIVLCLSTATTDLVAAPNDAAGPRAPGDGALIGVSPVTGPTSWPGQVLNRILQSKTFPAGGYCREGTVNVLFLVDRAGNLLSSEVAESSNVPAFDAEALAIIKRAHPFPPPPQSVGGAFVSLRIPIRFAHTPEGTASDKRFYLNLKSDSTLTLSGVAVDSKELDRAISSTTNGDKNARIIICNDQGVPSERVNDIAEQVKAAGFRFTVAPRVDWD